MAKRVLITSDTMGRDDRELGRLLMRNFIYSLARNADAPSAVMFLNEGVRLCCEGSEVLDDLELLREAGVPIKACGTCLDYLKLTETLRVGDVGTMVDAVAALMGEGDVLTIA